MQIVNEARFEEVGGSGDLTILYFTAPKSVLEGQYDDAEFATIAVECEVGCDPRMHARVTLSPTKFDEEEDSYVDYDPVEIYLDWNEMTYLLHLWYVHNKERGCEDAAL